MSHLADFVLNYFKLCNCVQVQCLRWSNLLWPVGEGTDNREIFRVFSGCWRPWNTFHVLLGRQARIFGRYKLMIRMILTMRGTVREFLTLSSANFLLHIHSSSQRAIVYKSRATHRVGLLLSRKASRVSLCTPWYTTCCTWWVPDVLHVICTRLRPSHLSARAGDNSWRSEQIVKKNRFAPFNTIVIIIIIIIIIVVIIITILTMFK